MRHYLRGLALVLVALNLLFWLWSSGSLKVFDWGPNDPREPHRAQEQLHPEALRLLSVNPRP